MKNIFANTISLFSGLKGNKSNIAESYETEIAEAVSNEENIILSDLKFRNKDIKEQLEINCDFIICDFKEDIKAYPFKPSEPFYIFAKRCNGDVYGFVGDLNNLNNCKIGYVSSDLQAGIIAQNLQALMTIIVFYPYWWSLLNYYDDEIEISVKKAENEIIINNEAYYKIQQQLASHFNLKSSDLTVKDFMAYVYNSPKFIVHSTYDSSPSKSIFKWNKRVVEFFS